MSLFHAVNVGLLASIALASTALASPVRGQSKEWTIEPPAGWQENADIASKFRDQLTSYKFKPQGIEARLWSSPGQDERLFIAWIVLPIDGNIEHEIDTFDREAVKGFAKSSIAVDWSRLVVGSMVIRDVRIDRMNGAEARVRMVRRYQPAVDGLHVLVAICRVASDPASCDAALDGVQFTVSHPIPLDDAAYQLGRAIGKLIIVLAPLLVLYYLVRRRLRARAAAVTAAEPPGPPPGPGAAADGR